MSDPLSRSESEMRWREEGVLRELLKEREMSIREMADELDCSKDTIVNWMDRFGIERRDSKETHPWRHEEIVRELYEGQRLTIPELADELGCSYSTARMWMNRHEIESRGRLEESHRSRLKKPAGHRFTDNGYEVVSTQVDGSTREARIHRLVAIAEHGPEQVAGKVVHHRNGVPWDNRPENLEVMSKSDHAKLHNPVEVRWGNATPKDALTEPEEENHA